MSIMELQQFEEIPRINQSFNSDIYSQHNLNLSFSKISKSKFAEHYHFLCKKCNKVPVIKFIARNKIKYTCECKESPRILLIKQIFGYLLYSEDEIDVSKLKCSEHEDEKYIFYCEKCEKNICNKCIENCIEHENRIKTLVLDRNTINKSKYIIQKLEKQNKTIIEDDIKSEDLEDNDIPTFNILPKKYLNNINEQIPEYKDKNNENNISNENNYFVIESKKNNIKIDINEEEIIDVVKDNNDDEVNDEEYFSLNLFSIIIDDYKNYPNYNHIETISNVEKYVSLSFGDYSEINLKYEFNEENIQYNSLELFGEIFANNNKDNCFLIINEKIIELNRYINLSEIFDNSNKIINWPIKLEVKLIEVKNKVMNNMSFMFYGINTLLPSSDFSKFDTININKMSYMFYNCSLIKQLPDITKFNTDNVTDMSYMFYNCSSLTQLPDISKFNTKNVNDMSYIFYNCSSITKLPDISKWNMENISDISNMFCDCVSLILIPDISNWNLNKDKVKNINYLFKNCKSLSKLPNLSKWKINEELYTYEMIEGCRLLEVDFKEKDSINEKFLDCLKRIINKSFIGLIITIFLTLILYIFFSILYFFFMAYFPFFSSFNLVKASYSTKNPLEYFELKNYTNITYIANFYNITNLTTIFETFETEENFINNKINFTSINKGIEFESDLNNYKILSIILSIIYTLNNILLLAIIVNNILHLFNNSKEMIILVTLFLLYIISVILSSLILIIINRLYNSLSYFYSLIIYLFKLKIPKANLDEVDYLNDSFNGERFNLIFSIIIITLIIIKCKDSIEIISPKSNRFFDILNEKN